MLAVRLTVARLVDQRPQGEAAGSPPQESPCSSSEVRLVSEAGGGRRRGCGAIRQPGNSPRETRPQPQLRQGHPNVLVREGTQTRCRDADVCGQAIEPTCAREGLDDKGQP